MRKLLQSFLICVLALLLCVSCAASTTEQSSASAPDNVASSQEAAPAGSEEASSAEPDDTAAQASSDTSIAEAPEAGYPLTVTDLQGTQVEIKGSDRIVSLTPSSTQILLSEGAETRIVGVDASSTSVNGAEVCGDYSGPDVEKIVSLEPDLVISGNSLQEDQIKQMRDAGLTVVSAEATTWDQVPESFTLIGQCTNEEANAQQLVDELQATIEQVEAQKPQTAPTCYFVLSFGDAGNWTSGPGSFINSMIQIAGGTCITDNAASAWVEYPIEDLVAANPDCIIFSSGAGSYDDLIKAPGYSELDAVKNNMVFEIDADTVSQPGPNLNEALMSVSSIIGDAAKGVPSDGAESGSEPSEETTQEAA